MTRRVFCRPLSSTRIPSSCGCSSCSMACHPSPSASLCRRSSAGVSCSFWGLVYVLLFVWFEFDFFIYLVFFSFFFSFFLSFYFFLVFFIFVRFIFFLFIFLLFCILFFSFFKSYSSFPSISSFSHLPSVIPLSPSLTLSFSPSATLATTLGILLWLVSYFLPRQLMDFEYNDLGLAPKILSCFLPNMAITWAFRIIAMFEGRCKHLAKSVGEVRGMCGRD